MIPVVNQKYKYILLYSAKAGCTSLRSLYLDVHHDELSKEQLGALDWYHNLNEVQQFDPIADYSDYFSYIITRNPYSRIVSAFLDQYAYARNDGVQAMMAACPPANEPDNFVEFLKYLNTVPDELRDTHFQSQAYFAYADMVVTPASIRYRILGQKPEHAFGVQYMGDVGAFNRHSRKVFKRLFRHDLPQLKRALTKIAELKRRNLSFYGEQGFPDAARLSVSELDQMVFAPKPQDFLIDPKARNLVEQIYQTDFELFGYKMGQVPQKAASKEISLIPADFDWKMYLRLNPDLPADEIYNERSVVRHFLEFGRFETTPRSYKIEAPAGFDWRRYLQLHADLGAAGITTEAAAIEHYISYGVREERCI